MKEQNNLSSIVRDDPYTSLNLFYMKRLLFFLILMGTGTVSQAQIPADALRFSSYEVLGTARNVGVGGSIGALGADFSVLSSNPAGLAAFRRSEFTVTPSFFLNTTKGTLDGSNTGGTNKNKLAFNINNLGFVISKVGRNPNWKTTNLGIGINRIANFQQTINYNGETTGSYVDFFQEASNGVAPEDLSNFTTGLAFDSEALYEYDPNATPSYFTDVELNENALLNKTETIKRGGGINEFSLSYAGNFKERLLIGGSIGFPFLSYREEKVYTEEDTVDDIPFYRDLQFDENLETSGSGVNLKLGVILRLNQMIRLGGAIHTPTRFTLTDTYSTKFLYDYVNNENDGPVEATSPESEFQYELKTPWRFMGNAGFIIKRSGFISAEVEYLKYSNSEFNLTENDNSPSTSDFQNNLNNQIANIYQSAINIRLGGEYALKTLRFRAGVTLSGTPYADTYIQRNPNIRGIGETRTTVAFGFGIRKERFFMDLALRLASQDGTYLPYSVTDFYPQNSVSTNSLQSHLMFTYGYKF